jgi:preprotein translocase subunit SecE
MASAKAQGTSFLSRIGQLPVRLWRFLRDVHSELQRVVWPSHEETYSFTVVVILAVGIVAAWVGALDLVMVTIMNALGLAD